MGNPIKIMLQNRKGVTLIELVLVVSFISIIIMLSYNMLFLTQRGFKSVNDSFDISEQLRIFQIRIQKEANQGKKAVETDDVFKKISATELYIYTDIDGDSNNIPELVRYRKDGDKLKRDVKYKKATSTEYPFVYQTSFTDEKVVLNNVSNTDIFGTVEKVREPISGQETEDYRRKVMMTLKIIKDGKVIDVQTMLVSKSRTETE